MELTPNLHAFLWTSTRANNCNTYLIRSPQKTILIDPGHAAYFDHVRQGLVGLGVVTVAGWLGTRRLVTLPPLVILRA